MRAVPAVGNTKPISSLSVVVFPAPLGPRKPKISPSSTVRCNGFKACFGFLRQKPTVYVFSNPRISIAAMRDSDGSRTKIIFKIQGNREWQGGYGGYEKQVIAVGDGSLASAGGPWSTEACAAHGRKRFLAGTAPPSPAPRGGGGSAAAANWACSSA